MDGHGCSAPAEYSNEMIFEGLNGFFDHVVPVVIWGNSLICHARCPDGILVRFRCLIVEDLVLWVDALSLHSGEGPDAGKYEFTASLIFHWFCS
jgi:hypothetical protein